MKQFLLILVLGLLASCASHPATSSNLEKFYQVRVGMSRDQVYDLLGKSQSGFFQGAQDVKTELWVEPTDQGGRVNRLAILFGSDGLARSLEHDTVVLE